MNVAEKTIVNNLCTPLIDNMVRVADVIDIAKIRHLRPKSIILSDRRSDGSVDKLNPVLLRELIDWDCDLIYQVSSPNVYSVEFASGECFQGIIDNSDSQVKPLEAEVRSGFWTKLFRRRRYTRPFVKISGLRRSQDANLAANLGADILGFDMDNFSSEIEGVLESLPETESVKAVSLKGGNMEEWGRAAKLLNQGLVDVVEFDGCYRESISMSAVGSNYFNLVKVSKESDIEALSRRNEPRVLLDPYSLSAKGLENGLIYKYIDDISLFLWLSGSIGCDNVKSIVKKFKPELVSVSEELMGSDGFLDPALARKFFKEVLYEK